MQNAAFQNVTMAEATFNLTGLAFSRKALASSGRVLAI